MKQASPARTHPQASHEIYDYPGEYVVASDGENYAKARIEERQWQYEQVQGRGTEVGLAVGSLFTLTGYDIREDQNREYLIVETVHQLQRPNTSRRRAVRGRTPSNVRSPRSPANSRFSALA